MEKVKLGYSIKNIQIPPRKSYLLQLMEKIEMVIKESGGKQYNSAIIRITTAKRNDID